jgi:PBSX family phage terminase large subunit
VILLGREILDELESVPEKQRGGGGSIDFIPHSPQQTQALKSKAPIVLLATGIQFGKTLIGAMRTFMKMIEFSDPSDNFIVTSPTYKILSQSTLPPMLQLLENYGTYHRQDAMFQMKDGGKCYFRTATDPDSIVGITNVRFIYGDEAGLYGLYFWENIQARAAFKNAQILLTTSPYTLNWVYKDLIRPKLKDAKARPDVDYIKARSIDNPYFNKDYYERMQRTMDERRFRAMFGGNWEKMEGLVYDVFDEDLNSVTPFELPSGTRYFAGVDWGTTAPFVIVVRAITLTGEHYQITERYKTGLTILDMIGAAKQLKQYYPIEYFACDPSAPGYIEEFNRAGLPAIPAANDVSRGIGLHYELVKTRRYKVFRGDNRYTIDEYETYHYPAPDEEITADKDVKDRVPVKQSDHALDANRYVTMATFEGLHRKAPEVISHLDTKGPLTIYERAARVFEPSQDRYEEF